MRVRTAWETSLTSADHRSLSSLLQAAFPGPQFAADRSWPASWARKQARLWLTWALNAAWSPPRPANC
ncbi:hypothetical protein [Dactylosporangium sp. CA-233914]|uniref:hypothetical protein n=1 Tax=Dactylosporangium sp. CA-233914 TaxID=3239934 RepID=UPI003D9313C4